jgi:hypothetical protein
MRIEFAYMKSFFFTDKDNLFRKLSAKNKSKFSIRKRVKHLSINLVF